MTRAGPDDLRRRVFPHAPPERLAVFRILVGCFAVLYLGVRARAFLSLADADTSRFEPVGVLSALRSPLPAAVLAAVYAGALLAGVAFVAGWWFRVTGPALALALLALCTYRSSFGQMLWFENLLVLDVLIVGFSRSADALHVSRPTTAPKGPPAERYGVPLRAAALATVATYVVAAVAKLRLGGLGWATGDSLRNHVAATVVRAEMVGTPASPIGRRLVEHGWIFPPMAATSLILELAAPLALIGGHVRDAWVALTWLMHASIAVLMYVVFPFPLLLVAFAPLYDLERLITANRPRESA